MKHKRGFTLVELLAVIIVLAVLVLLAVPSVLKMMDNAKTKSFKIETENIGKAAKSAYAEDILKDDKTRQTTNGYCYSISYLQTNGYIDKTFKAGSTGSVLIGEEEIVWFSNGERSVTGGLLGTVSVDATLQSTTTGFDTCSGAVDGYNVYKQTILNGAYPRLDPGMIPVTIANNGTVTTVNPTSSTWYNYTNKEWANVVLVKDTGTQTRTYYQTTYGVTVSEADILAYLVWIPRYRYTLWNVAGTAATYTGGCTNTSYYSASTCTANSGTWTEPACTANCPQSISITFESAYTAKSTGSTNGTQLTHPAFTYGGRELSGIWVGKFETTQGTALNVGTTNPTIKPNIVSWRSQNVSNQFNESLLFNSNTAYGITAESRMSKNSDWGAVIYLSHSTYGINTEIRLNNNSNYTTGCGASAINLAGTATCEIAYGGAAAYPQSTTGNITGIFDMSGGANEYQMGVYTNTTSTLYSGTCNIYNSGYNGLYGSPGTAGCNAGLTEKTDGLNYPNAKYYKLYPSASWQSNIANLGEALGETQSWYKDFPYFVYAGALWFYRGGYYGNGVGAGGFSLYNSNGSPNGYISFRSVVLVS